MNKRILIILLSGWLLQACVDVEVQPTDEVPAEQAFASKNSIQAVLNGVYDGLQSAAIVQDYVFFADLAADNFVSAGSNIAYREIGDNRITSFNGAIEGIWNSHYDVINRANELIAGLSGNPNFDQEFLDSQIGQARFIRSFAYFNLVRMFGPIPYREQPAGGDIEAEINQPRVDTSTVYQNIINDLNAAEVELEGTGTGSDNTLVSEAAVKALLARVYLYHGNNDMAAEKAQEVIDFGYSLVSSENYMDIFNEAKSNDEIIFAIDYVNDEARNTLSTFSQPEPEGRLEVAATKALYDAFADEDLRKDTAVVQEGDIYYLNKYTDVVNLSDNGIVLRLAEMYLIKAEALNELNYVADGEAFDLLNEVRNRAGLADLDASMAASQEEFLQYIKEERRRELAGEGHRWFDLIRYGDAVEMLEEKGTLRRDNDDLDNQLLFPIPQSEIDTNLDPEMYQNEGY